jgi:hypothetical protein
MVRPEWRNCRYYTASIVATKNAALLVFSDGGTINDDGSFNWVLGTDQEVL